MAGGRPKTVTLTDNSQQNVQAAPGAGKAIKVVGFEADNDQASKTVLSIKEGSTVKFTMVLAPYTGGPLALPDEGWILPEDTALTVQQDLNSGSTYVTALTHVVPARPLPY